MSFLFWHLFICIKWTFLSFLFYFLLHFIIQLSYFRFVTKLILNYLLKFLFCFSVCFLTFFVQSVKELRFVWICWCKVSFGIWKFSNFLYFLNYHLMFSHFYDLPKFNQSILNFTNHSTCNDLTFFINFGFEILLNFLR